MARESWVGLPEGRDGSPWWGGAGPRLTRPKTQEQLTFLHAGHKPTYPDTQFRCLSIVCALSALPSRNSAGRGGLETESPHLAEPQRALAAGQGPRRCDRTAGYKRLPNSELSI